MRAFYGANLALRFLLELAALAALASFGADATSSTAANVLLAIAAPALAIAIWGMWSAPRASRRLPGRPLVLLELSLLAASALALAGAGHVILAGVFAAVAVANGVVLRRLREESRASSNSRLRPESRAPRG